MASKNLVAQVTRAASYNILLQVSLRIVTFVLNAYILRHITRDSLGVINVRLLLLYTTVQFLSREPFRRSCLSGDRERRWSAVINVAWFSVPVSVAIGVLSGFVWLRVLQKPDPDLIGGYAIGVYSVVSCVVIEMLAEPLYIVGQAFHYVKFRVLVEGGSVGLRCVLMAALVTAYPRHPVWAFSVSQLVASCLYTAVFYTYFGAQARKQDGSLPFHSVQDIVPCLRASSEVDREASKLAWSFAKQTVVKQLLTEGERYLMTLFNLLTFAEQGVYDVVGNLGSLAARFIFQPVEESGYLLFAQTLRRDVNQQRAEDIVLSASVLDHLLRLMSHSGLVILTFGQTYSTALLYLYGGSALSVGGAPTLLRWHCVYVLFLALNGVTECFVFAAMNREEIDRHNKRLAVFSVGFLVAATLLTRSLGAVGFMLANSLNMAARISHGAVFIKAYFSGTSYRPLRGAIPSTAVFGVCAFSYLVTRTSEGVLCCNSGIAALLGHIALGMVCFVLVLGTVFLKERTLFEFLAATWRTKNVENESAKVK